MLKNIQGIKTLDEVWKYVNQLNRKHFPDNRLMPILGNGKTFRPKVMFMFINPTARNISLRKEWKGPRFPFIGTKQVWRVFHKAGLFDDMLMEEIEHSSDWSIEFTNQVLGFLQNKGFYLTNVVKCTEYDATLPNSKKIKLFLPLLMKEIEIVQPEYIVTFGLIPFERLTGKKIKLSEHYLDINKNKKLKFYELKINSFKTTSKIKVIPCYFPVGRGNPRRAVEILKMVNAL